jgi:D-3-phosphoglycerate dehydrogenase / 2-oxoglutarate reductase
MATVVQTDHAWPDVEIERGIIEGAGHVLLAPFASATAQQVIGLVDQAQPEAIMTCWAPVPAEAISRTRDLRVVARMGVGLDNIAVEQATARGAWVTNVPDYCVEEVSDHAVGLLLALARGIVHLNGQVHSGIWNPGGAQLRRVRNLSVGIIGYGRIGQRTAAKLAALTSTVLALQPRTRTPSGPVHLVDLDTILARADAIVLHVPLTSETEHLVDAAFLARMRPGSVLINVSRGAVVDTRALLVALEHGPLAAAALDVVEGEPSPAPDLLRQPNLIITPHVGFASDASVLELRTRAAEEVVRILGGQQPLFPCNAPA